MLNYFFFEKQPLKLISQVILFVIIVFKEQKPLLLIKVFC